MVKASTWRLRKEWWQPAAASFLLVCIALLAESAGPRPRELKGTAVIEGRQDTLAGILLEADGRWLLVDARTRYLPVEGHSGSPATPERLQVGNFLQYRGTELSREDATHPAGPPGGRPGKFLRVTELAAWDNLVQDEDEQRLYAEFEPRMKMPADPQSLAILEVGQNRYPLLDDRDVQGYLDLLGRKLLPQHLRSAQAAARFGHAFWFVVASRADLQASAFPNGVVVLHAGTFRLAENEAQLTFALAHEIAHVVQKHAWREAQLARGRLRALRWATAGASYIVETAIRSGYQREHEAQADRVALAYMARAGFDPRQSLAFLTSLERHRPYMSALFWDTHRTYSGRRRALEAELAALGTPAGESLRSPEASLRRDSEEFQALRERIPTASIGTPRSAPKKAHRNPVEQGH